MISITKLCCDYETSGDVIRYGSHVPETSNGGPLRPTPRSAKERRPVVAWNVTRRCNLKCIHCYTDSDESASPDELTTDEGKTLLDDLATFQIPALLFSGGEPLMRKDIFELIAYARKLGIRSTLSTNGTLITPEIAQRVKDVGVSYVGISLDGIGEVNDCFRGKKGAFELAMRGFKNCVAVGQKVGLRMTLTRHNFKELHGIFDFIEREQINRACFYHLVYSGRGSSIADEDLTHSESRAAVDIIIERSIDFHRRGLKKDILTVDNHVDGVYLYRKMREQMPERAEAILKLLKWNGGGLYSSGVGFADIDFYGNVHPDQFWMHYNFGNVRKRKFSDIWMDTSDTLMAGLKNRRAVIKGRCAECQWFDACGGSLRVRADLVYNDPFAPDPGCYLSDEEIGLTPEKQHALESRGEIFPMPQRLLQ